MKCLEFEFTNGEILPLVINSEEEIETIINKFKNREILDVIVENEERYVIDLKHVCCITVGDSGEE